MQFSTSSVPFGLSLIFPHKSRAKIATHDAWPPPLSRYSYYSVPLIIEGGAYNLCWCGPPARTWNIAPGRWNRVERQWLVWQVIGVAQVIKNGVLMGSSYYESLMFAQVYYVYYIYIFVVTRFWNRTPDMYPGYVWQCLHEFKLLACTA